MRRPARLLVALAGAAALLPAPPAPAGSLRGPYTDPAQLTALPFGAQSHWLQPWRAWMETVPAGRWIDGAGVVVNPRGDENPRLVARMLARHGIRHVRYEIPWSDLAFTGDGLSSRTSARHAAWLRAFREHDLRPLILLWGHEAAPCPLQRSKRTVSVTANAGSRTVVLDDASGLAPGRSGVSDLTAGWAAEAIVTDVAGRAVTLSKPLPRALSAGAQIDIATLRFKPFGTPGSPDHDATLAGWRRYLETVARFAADSMGTAKEADRGFDLEIWNELTFGSRFLDASAYHDPDPYGSDPRATQRAIVAASAAAVEGSPELFRGVALSDGFANTLPWPSAMTSPVPFAGLGKHPYQSIVSMPAQNPPGRPVDALGQGDASGFVPSYEAVFPEYYGTGIQTETVLRDGAPIATDVQGTLHGRNTRVIDGIPRPMDLWISEVNLPPVEAGVRDREAALRMKAKAAARYMAFYLNKGARYVDLYAAFGDEIGYGTLLPAFSSLARRDGAAYPDDDDRYTSPALQVLGRTQARMREGLERSLPVPRAIEVRGISDRHDNVQFRGDGTSAHPDLHDREVLAILPFQVNARRFIVPYYVMTRDLRRELAPEPFTVELGGVAGSRVGVSAYDPLGDRDVPVRVLARSTTSVTVELSAADHPYLLALQEGTPPAQVLAREKKAKKKKARKAKRKKCRKRARSGRCLRRR